MSIVDSSTIPDGHTQADGRRRIKHSFVDHLGRIKHTGLITVDGMWTETEYAAHRAAMIADREAQESDTEVQYILSELSQGRNPLRDTNNNPVNPNYQTYADAVKKIVRYLSQLSSDEILQYKPALQFLANITDPQWTALGFNLTKVNLWKTYLQNLFAASNSREVVE